MDFSNQSSDPLLVWFQNRAVGVGKFNSAIYIFPQPTPVAMATKFDTK